ncbi:MAG: hypothetical protein PHX83_14585 [Acidobacteriia bacterium]|nr:hypothetical protein [Terriglobia bacterium]
MATLEYNMGTPLGPDARAVTDLQAIDDYVRTVARKKIKAWPKSLPLVEDYEKWRQQVSWWDLNVMVNDTMRTAKAKRDAINVAQGSTFDPSATVEEGAFLTSPPDTSGASKVATTVLVAGAGAVGGVWLFRKYLMGKVHLA